MSDQDDEKTQRLSIPENKVKAAARRLGVTLEQMDQFFIASGWSEYKCEVCGGENFQLGLYDGHLMPLSVPTSASSNHALWVVHVTCVNCANVKFISVPRLRELLGKPADGGVD